MATDQQLTPAEARDFQRLAGYMIPASAEHKVPAASDPAIFADIVKSIGRDFADVRKALAGLARASGGSFADVADDKAESVAMAFLAPNTGEIVSLGRCVLQCYYRDDRVVRSLGLEPRPPFPKGHTLEQGDWSLLDVVKQRKPFWRSDKVA
jgi:hypothetical protein